MDTGPDIKQNARVRINQLFHNLMCWFLILPAGKVTNYSPVILSQSYTFRNDEIPTVLSSSSLLQKLTVYLLVFTGQGIYIVGIINTLNGTLLQVFAQVFILAEADNGLCNIFFKVIKFNQ